MAAGRDTGTVFEPTALIAEDDDELRRLVVAGLREAGFAADGVGTGSALLSLLESRSADVLVVDIGLPDADGRDVCQALRARGDDTPVLFLTARDAIPDRISGFTAGGDDPRGLSPPAREAPPARISGFRGGGDDYVPKPFSLAEVVVRLKALIRRTADGQPIDAHGLELDPVRHNVTVAGRSQPLTP